MVSHKIMLEFRKALKDEPQSMRELCNKLERSEGSVRPVLTAMEELRKRDPVTPFVLAIHCENLGTKIAPKVCGNWLKADGWIENKPGWLKN